MNGPWIFGRKSWSYKLFAASENIFWTSGNDSDGLQVL